MKTIRFENLKEGNPKNKNFGKTVELTVPDDFDEQAYEEARQRGAEFGARFARIAAMASESGKKVKEAFGNV